MTAPAGEPFGVYVHWPFCATICPYCDFNVYREREIDDARWVRALARDLQFWAAKTPERKLTSLYFGGGTPSLAPLSVIEGVIEECARLWGFAADPEITLEANPTDAELMRFEDFARAGVNRLSLGVQSLDDASLSFLGRQHDARAAERALARALAAFARVSVDLIYALPGQTLESWKRELTRAMASGAGHLSLYQLTIEDGTAFGKAVARRDWRPADEEIAADLFEATQNETRAAGYPAYEVSNHARAGEESRHNFLYWRQQDYVGVGPGAHGRVTIGARRLATETALHPRTYLERVEKEGSGATTLDPLSDDERLTERLAMGLRTSEGVSLSACDRKSLEARIAALAGEGLLSEKSGRLIASDDGRRLLNHVLERLTA